MSYTDLVTKEFRPHFKTIYDDLFGKKDPDEFKYNGSQVYHGMQRQGKTLSMIKHSRKLKKKFPKLAVASNIWLSYLKPVEITTSDALDELMSSESFQNGEWQQEYYIRYRSYDNLLLLLKRFRGGGVEWRWGVHFMIDEIHQYFHSHDSKSMPVWVATIFSQQGKQYILVTATVQVWDNVIKALREQIQNLILCRKVIGFMISQTVVDPSEFENEYGERVAPIKKKGFFFMTKELRESYDTRELVDSGREIFGGSDTSINVKMVDEKSKNKNRFGRKAQVR